MCHSYGPVHFVTRQAIGCCHINPTVCLLTRRCKLTSAAAAGIAYTESHGAITPLTAPTLHRNLRGVLRISVQTLWFSAVSAEPRCLPTPRRRPSEPRDNSDAVEPPHVPPVAQSLCFCSGCRVSVRTDERPFCRSLGKRFLDAFVRFSKRKAEREQVALHCPETPLARLATEATRHPYSGDFVSQK